MTTRVAEIWVGLFVAGGIAALFMLAMKVSNLSTYSSDSGYQVTAYFEDISGLKVRSPVTMSGVRIGRVSGISFDKQRLSALVTMEIEGEYDTLPDDSSASIYTAGLLGEKYIGLEPGAGSGDCEEISMDENGEIILEESVDKDCKPGTLQQGSEIKLTQDSLVLEKLIGQFISKFLDDSGDDAKSDGKKGDAK